MIFTFNCYGDLHKQANTAHFSIPVDVMVQNILMCLPD